MTTASTLAITPEIVREHGLTPEEYDKVKQLLGGREPTITELGIFSVMWSEHCSYKSSRVHLKRLPTRSRRVVQGPGENAGIIDIGDGWACAFKIESHNHPSFIEPFQGAATGVGGILRDIFTMGARPVAVMDSLRFGPIVASTAADKSVRPTQGDSRQGEIHKNHSLLEGVVSGIASYGNCFGVPNLGGETKFEACYSGNPLVNAFALGLVRLDQIFYAKAAGEGNPVIYVGSKTGRDGIHGATMASEEFSETSEAKRPNVQVGDPFLEKLLLEACLEAMQTGAIVGIQDMGAAGLTCSTCEMGARGHVGTEIELDRVPQRETGMTAYEIMLSESQERMLLVAQKGREDEVFRVFEKWGLDAVEIGRVTNDGKMRVLHHGEIVSEISNEALTDDAPVYKRPLERWEPPVPREMLESIKLAETGDLTDNLKRLLASPNTCGKRWVWQQYDHMVQTNTVEGPGAGDAGVIRIKNSDSGGSERGLAMALDGNSRWCYLDPQLGAMHAVAEAARNVACSGATPVGATNCLNFGNPEKPQIMWQFSKVIDGITKACEELDVPITGGNVSFYNETLGEGIYPTPVIGIVGILEDVHKAVFPHFREPGRAVVLLRASEPGDLVDAESEFGSSEYAKEILGAVWGFPPALELEREAALQKALIEMSRAGLVESAHDCSEGGIAVTLAESAFGKGVGVRANLASLGLPPEFVLFGEDASRVVISCDRSKLARIQEVAAQYRLCAEEIGETVSDRVEIKLDGRIVVSASVSQLRGSYESALEAALRADPELVAVG
jgi:phosphoribosylformylglycinamidine synthase subunit PurL